MQGLDFNLLMTLDVLLRHESVTRAAEELGLSIPAMSRQLVRIRQLMKDPILVRAGRGLVPTPRALELRPQVTALAMNARTLISAPASSLAEAQRTFTIRTEDSIASAFATPISTAIRKTAPGISLRFIGQGDEEIGPLREGVVDLDIGNIKLRGPEVKVQSLFETRFVGAVRPGHTLSRNKVTAARFAAELHISASRRGLQWGPIDDALAVLKLARRVVLVVPSFYAALASAATSDMVASVPEYYTQAAAALFGVHTFSLPLSLKSSRISQAWHPRFDADPVHRFVRECIRAECKRTVPGSKKDSAST